MLHPSGYCVWYNESSSHNLVRGVACPLCGMVAGHKPTCENFRENETKGQSSRPKLYNAAALLWYYSNAAINFFTFTLPSRKGYKVYQLSPTCEKTGDLAITAKFSRLLESVAVNIKRHAGEKFSYVWISEAQMKRQKKFGGVGDLHFHLVTDAYIDIMWLQNTWNNHVGVISKSSVDVQRIPRSVRSIPAYLIKYMGKGAQRYIYSRRFSCTRNLSSHEPISLNYLPNDMTPVSEKVITQKSGYQTCFYFYATNEVITMYGAVMVAEKNFKVKRTDKNFTTSAIESRKYNRSIKQNQKLWKEKNGWLFETV